MHAADRLRRQLMLVVMRINSSHLVVAFLLLASAGASTAQVIEPGHRLVVYAHVSKCMMALHFIDYAQVNKSGEVELYGIKLKIAGKTTQELSSRLRFEMNPKGGEMFSRVIVSVPERNDPEAIERYAVMAERAKADGLCPNRDPLPFVPDWGFDHRVSQAPAHNKKLQLTAYGGS